MSIVVGYSSMNLEILDNVNNCGYRNMKLFGGGTVALTAMFGCYLLFFLIQLSAFLSVVHVYCAAMNTKHLSEYCSVFK